MDNVQYVSLDDMEGMKMEGMKPDKHAFSVEVPIWESEVEAFRNAFDLPDDTDMVALFTALAGHTANMALSIENFTNEQVFELVMALEASETWVERFWVERFGVEG